MSDEPTPEDIPVNPDIAGQLLYEAWCVIANVGWHQGGWDAQHPEWLAAAIRWRDGWHAWLDSHQPRTFSEFDDEGAS